MRYFIAKVNNFPSLRKAVEESRWACADRFNPPQPWCILTEAFSQGKVVVIFSVSNCHGWHGYAEMINSPVEQVARHREGQNEHEETDECADECKDKRNLYYYFNIKWILHFLEFGEQCLLSKETEDLTCTDQSSKCLILVNKCRNWQEIDNTTGEILCKRMKDFYDTLIQKREEKNQKKLEKQPETFYKETKELTVEEVWRKIVAQVEKDLGRVILACPFGSQRYNLHTPESDTDMFIVYQAKTSDILGFHPPKETIKNHETETCDYTIHEVFRYCELLLSGDARCVETLFLDDRTVVQTSPEWEELKNGRQFFLSRDCLDKYLRDAQGSKGTKYLKKWCAEHPEEKTLPPKMCKMLYVIMRLLQNARDIASGPELKVYREHGTQDRELLMRIRDGNISVADALKMVGDLEAEIDSKADDIPPKLEAAEKFLTKWILKLRFNNFQNLDNDS